MCIMAVREWEEILNDRILCIGHVEKIDVSFVVEDPSYFASTLNDSIAKNFNAQRLTVSWEKKGATDRQGECKSVMLQMEREKTQKE